jgi:hypothetical protein
MVKIETEYVLIRTGQSSGAGDSVAGTWAARSAPDRMGLMVTK